MGCFSVSCPISNLTIGYNDKVRWIPLVQNPYNKNHPCYDYDLMYPLSWNIQASYNDYGSIEHYNEESLAVKTLMTNFPGRAFEDILQEIRDGSLTLKIRPDKEPVKVYQIMILEEVWQALLANHVFPSYDVVREELERAWEICGFRLDANAPKEALIERLELRWSLTDREKFPELSMLSRQFGGTFEHFKLAREVFDKNEGGTFTWWSVNEFLRNCAEQILVPSMLRVIGFYWRPSYWVTTQSPEHLEALKILQTFVKIAQKRWDDCREECGMDEDGNWLD